MGAAIRPALRYDLVLGPEPEALHAVLADVAEARPLPAAEAVIGDRDRDRHVDTDHADVHARGEFARGMAVAGEDRDAVSIVVLRGEPDRFLEVLRPDHLQDRAENLFPVALHVGCDMVEEGRTDEKAFFVALQFEATAVDDELGALVDTHLDIVLDALLMGAADDRAVMRFRVGRDADTKTLDSGDQLLAKRVRGLLTDGDNDGKGHAAL